MKKIIHLADFLLLAGVITLLIVFMNSCEKTDSGLNTAEKKHKPATVATSVIYYSPDDSIPYICYQQCTVNPAPTGISYVSNSGQVLQVGLDSLGYSGNGQNYADSIQYALQYNGATFAVWTEKWCNTNGCFIYESTATAPPSQVTIQSLMIQAGITDNNPTIQVSVTAYGNNATPSPTFTTNPILLNF